MYCPKCGEPLEKRSGAWRCTSGGLEFSVNFGDMLEARFAGGYRPGRRSPGRMQIDLWYCPSCGCPTEDNMSCPLCNQTLRDFLFTLVDLHPHADGRGGWR